MSLLVLHNGSELRLGREILTLHSTDEQSSTSSPSESRTLQNNKMNNI